MNLLAARRIEPGDVHLLPDGFDLEWVLVDECPGALFKRVGDAAFADAGDAGVGLNGHHHVALRERLIQVRRFVDADAGDLDFLDKKVSLINVNLQMKNYFDRVIGGTPATDLVFLFQLYGIMGMTEFKRVEGEDP